MTHSVGNWLESIEKQLLTADLYYGHGTDNAWDEAVQLLLFALGLPVDSDSNVLKQVVTAQQTEMIQKLLQSRIDSRMPLPYLTHQAWFAGLSFYVDERVLIPRSPFAEWIQRQFQPWITDPNKIHYILEIGTGSGCMAITAALTFDKAQVDAVDISADALAVAKRNVTDYCLEKRIHLIQSDCFANLPSKRYDLIISNPPYVSEQEMQLLPAEYQYEPKLALEASEQGLAIVDRILQQANRYLANDGILIVEVGNSEEALLQRYPQLPFIWLEMEHGGHGVFLLTAEDLRQHFTL